jgi:hypothetical protein
MLAVIALFVMVPFASFTKTTISDEDLDAVTAAAGVSLTFTNVTIGGTTTLSSISWGDPTGFTGFTQPGYYGFQNFAISGNLAEISGIMNIDVGTSGTSTRLNIVLPAITIGGAAGMNIQAWMMADTQANLGSANVAEAGIISIRGFSTQVSGTISIFAH